MSGDRNDIHTTEDIEQPEGSSSALNLPFEPLPGPELFFGVTGAVGTDLTLVCSVLKEVLREVQYDNAEVIRLSDLLRSIEGNEEIPRTPLHKNRTADGRWGLA